jgi:protein-S-isoprenylcysteine O-methyltransferase Ste14
MIFITVSVLLWGTLHSVLASDGIKELVRRIFGIKVARYYRLFFNAFAILSFLPILILLINIPDHILYLVPNPWSLLMIAGQILAFIALLLGFLQIDVAEFLGFTQLKVSSPDEVLHSPIETHKGQLVTSGLYKIVRHPLYTAGLIFIWLIPLMSVNVLFVNIGLTIYIVIGTLLEERKLFRAFDREYADYAGRTSMLIPLPRRNKAPRKSSM